MLLKILFKCFVITGSHSFTYYLVGLSCSLMLLFNTSCNEAYILLSFTADCRPWLSSPRSVHGGLKVQSHFCTFWTIVAAHFTQCRMTIRTVVTCPFETIQLCGWQLCLQPYDVASALTVSHCCCMNITGTIKYTTNKWQKKTVSLLLIVSIVLFHLFVFTPLWHQIHILLWIFLFFQCAVGHLAPEWSQSPFCCHTHWLNDLVSV